MPDQRWRSVIGGCIDRSTTLNFYFDGRAYCGHPGDTLASALLANGISVVGRSFKYHRPRGIFGSGSEEPNALVSLQRGSQREVNLKATQVELFDGLIAFSQNRWPSLGFDLGAINDLLAPLLPAGFYYKTFMWPPSWWGFYESLIRRMAGLGRAGEEADNDRYAQRYVFCDVLVIGAGAAGLMAASHAAQSGARVILVDEMPEIGGRLLSDQRIIEGVSAKTWASSVAAKLRQQPAARLLSRTTAVGYYDHNMVVLAERLTDHLSVPPAHLPRQRLWWVRARQVVLANGAIERPLMFPGNDRPGIMLASAAQTYTIKYGIRCAIRAAVFTNNDLAYQTAVVLQQSGVSMSLIIDTRTAEIGEAALRLAERYGIEVLKGHTVVGSIGRFALRAIRIAPLGNGTDHTHQERVVKIDRLCVSGGWNPSVHLFSQSQGKLHFDTKIASFVPGDAMQKVRTIGAANGHFGLAECLQEGVKAGLEAARDAGYKVVEASPPNCNEALLAEMPLVDASLWVMPHFSKNPRSRDKQFVDLQNDVSVDDVQLAVREGYQSVEHLKRYTTLGMGTDQGRTSNVNGLAVLAASLNSDTTTVGHTTFRPPYAPLPLGTIAGPEVGKHLRPVRRTAMHDWHQAHQAVFVEAGDWLRAQYYPKAGEDIWHAIHREAQNVRQGVGLVDVSTLGKIEVRGRDAGEFLHRMCINRIRNLNINRCRYWFMLREDGFILDDGTVTRIDECSFYVTTSTAHAAAVMTHLEFYAQTVWPELHVHVVSVTDQFAAMALSGPLCREVLQSACSNMAADSDAQSLPFMAATSTFINGIAARLIRMTFSGELAYELHVAADHGIEVWEAILKAGKLFGIQPYGTEAIGILRIEKGHVAMSELDGRTIPADFGFAKLQKDEDFVGKRSLERKAIKEAKRRRIVGLESINGKGIPRGAHLVWNPTVSKPIPVLGHISAVCYSPNLDKHIALALLEEPECWHGKILYASSPLLNRQVPVRVVNSVFIDPSGQRARC